jgi:hypothetical protein
MIRISLIATTLILVLNGSAQAQQGFFLDTWKPRNAQIPSFTETQPADVPANVSVTIHASDTLTRIPLYVFGDNANTWTSSMSENKTLMKRLTDRNMGVLRGPGGSISDVYFWNRSHYSPPPDVPAALVGGGADWPWYGKRPDPWEAGWTMDVDSFYSILSQTGVTGMITVNYGYARYGTSADPVAQAAHLAAEWVRYDNGRTRFWEIGNEVSGSWEAGYQIDPALNKDGQPAVITADLYGRHCKVFIDSMKAAAAENGVQIYIGAVASESASSGISGWNVDLMKRAGDVIDFYVVHSYFTPYNQNSNAKVILAAPTLTKGYYDYVKSCAAQAGKPMRPVALTEYNTFAIGSNQAVSQVAGMFAAMVVVEAAKSGLGEASRWDLANGWDNGNDMGMFSNGDEPGVSKFAPRPAFYYLYYLQKYLGDRMVKTTFKGTSDITAYSSSFSSGHVSTMVVNKGVNTQQVRINIDGARIGSRYYTYTLVGGTDVSTNPLMPYSRKVYVNGSGPSGVAGGPLNYETLAAQSASTEPGIRVTAPPYSVTYVIADTGNIVMPVNDTIGPIITWNNPAAIVYGTALSATQLNATTTIPGSFVYDPPAGTKLNAGNGIELNVTFNPTDTATYTAVSKTVTITVSKATPIVQWATPADIVHPAPLDSSQLNATANVPGVFIYDPPAGSVLDAGSAQVLQVSFTPADTANYTHATKSVLINVTLASGLDDAGGKEIRLFPIPVSDLLSVTGISKMAAEGNLSVHLLNADGRLIPLPAWERNGDILRLSVHDLVPGVYTLRLQSSGKTVVKRFVRQ